MKYVLNFKNSTDNPKLKRNVCRFRLQFDLNERSICMSLIISVSIFLLQKQWKYNWKKKVYVICHRAENSAVFQFMKLDKSSLLDDIAIPTKLPVST